MNTTANLLDAAMTALQNGDESALEKLLSEGFDPDTRATRKSDGETFPLLFLAATNHRGNKCLEQLLAAGANPDTTGRISLVYNKSFHEKSGMTTLMVAACEKSLRCVKALLKAGADVTLQNASGETALSLAREAGGKQIIKLLEKSASEASQVPAEDLTLHDAVITGQQELVARSLASGANVNETDGDGRTALMLAIQHDDVAIVETLLTGGADATVAWPGRRESTWSKVLDQRSATTLAAMLLSAVPDSRSLCNGIDQKEIETASLWSGAFRMQRKGQAAAVTQLLVDSGLYPNERLSNGMTPLLLAASRSSAKSVDALKILLDNRADPNALTEQNHAALRKYEVEMAAMEARGQDVSSLRARLQTHSPLGLLEVAKANSRKVHAAISELLGHERVLDEYEKADSVIDGLKQAATSKAFVELKDELAATLQTSPKSWRRQAGVAQFSIKLQTLQDSDAEVEDDDALECLEPFQVQAAQAGATLIYNSLPEDPATATRLLLLPTRSTAAVLRICGTNADNYGLSTSDVVNKLAEINATWPFELQGCGSDFVAVQFSSVEEHERLYETLLAFCPELNGEDSAPTELAEFFRSDGRVILWWD